MIDRASCRGVALDLRVEGIDLLVAGAHERINRGGKSLGVVNVAGNLPNIGIHGKLLVEAVIHLIRNFNGQMFCQFPLHA